MVEKIKSGFTAIGFHRVEVLITEKPLLKHQKQRGPSKQELWVEENCEGRFFIGSRKWVGQKLTVHPRILIQILPFLFESEIDMMAFKLRWL